MTIIIIFVVLIAIGVVVIVTEVVDCEGASFASSRIRMLKLYAQYLQLL